MKAFINIALTEDDAKTETLTVIAGKTGEVLAKLHAEGGQCVVEVEDGDDILIGGDWFTELTKTLEEERTKSAQLTQANIALELQVTGLTGQLDALKVENEKLKTPAA